MNESYIDALFDDPDFQGILIQRFHVSGDERMEVGIPMFIRKFEEALIREWFKHIDDRTRITPLFSR